jgi:hypothetical protein
MEHGHKVDFPLAHHVDVGEAISYLVHQLECDNWYVACHHEHLFVFRLTLGSADKYAVKLECTAPVEKGVYHGSKAWFLSISPLHNSANLTEDEVKRLEAGLAALK